MINMKYNPNSKQSLEFGLKIEENPNLGTISI